MKTPDRCPRCGASIAWPQASLAEIALRVVFAATVLSICIPVFLVAMRWVEEEVYRIADRMVWHEPLDSWKR